MHRLAAVLFDLDGVLIDTERSVTDLWHRLALRHHRRLTDEMIDAYVRGCAPEHTVSHLFADLGPADRRTLLEEVRKAEPHLESDAIPGAREVVSRLHAGGVPLGLVTGASAARAERSLAELGLGGTFDAKVTWGEVTRGKPAPDAYELAADRLGLPPGACLVVEDAPSGVRAACAAGAVCLGVGGPALGQAGATWVAPALGEVEVRSEEGCGGPVLTVSGTKAVTFLPQPARRPVSRGPT
ncbi:HAD family hydrolase [Streptomyces sp. NPDC059740]|uniref:HAD family hydrolase n=1 Tax=Streptomyces sp. NPDC059740 TaxID=3346926 RepID=UPI00364C69A2